MRRSAIPAVLVAGLLALSSCSSLQSDDDASGPPTVTVTTTKPGKAPKPTGGKGSGKSGDRAAGEEPRKHSARGYTEVPREKFLIGDGRQGVLYVKNLNVLCIDLSRKEDDGTTAQFSCSNLEGQLHGTWDVPAEEVDPMPQNSMALDYGPTGYAWQGRATLASLGGSLTEEPRELAPGEKTTFGTVTCKNDDDELECEASEKTGVKKGGGRHWMRITKKHVYIDGQKEPLGGSCVPLEDQHGMYIKATVSRGGNNCETMQKTLQEFIDSGYRRRAPEKLSTGYSCALGYPRLGGKVQGYCVDRSWGQYREFTLTFED